MTGADGVGGHRDTGVRRASRPAAWLRRYGPLELAGTAGALLAGWLAHAATGQLAVAAVAGAIGENVGFYGMAALREARRVTAEDGDGAIGPGRTRARRIAVAGRTAARLAREFGPAEIVDSAWVRPGLMYAMGQLLAGAGVGAGIVAGKLAADAAFYAVAIAGHERRRRAAAARP